MGCIACIEKDDRYPHTCNKGGNKMTEREQEIVIKMIDENEGRPDSLNGCSMYCAGIACDECPVTKMGDALTLEELRKLDPRKKPTGEQAKESIEGVTEPSHYMLFDDIEAIEVIARSMTREQFKGYCLGNILKYRLRAGKKSELAYLEKDIAKAGFYGELYEKHKEKCYG